MCNVSIGVWHYYFPSFDETEEDATQYSTFVGDTPRAIARQLAEQEWYKCSPDYFEELEIVLISPSGKKHTFTVDVEVEPSFSVFEER